MGLKIVVLGENSYLRDQVEGKLGPIGGRDGEGMIVGERLDPLLAARGLETSFLVVIASPLPEVWLRRLREQPSLAWTPVVVVSDRAVPARSAQCYELGAADVVSVAAPGEELAIRLRAARQKADRLQAAAFRDSLTGMYNRRFFSEYLSGRIAAQAEISPVSFVLLDVDYFKTINDTYGHSTGDEVLRTLADVLRKNVRKSDWVIRYGGEEFLLLLAKTSAEEAKMTMDSVAGLVSTTAAFDDIGVQRTITFSSGIAEWNAGRPFREMIGQADRALYRAKNAGRCRNVIDRPDPPEAGRTLFIGAGNDGGPMTPPPGIRGAGPGCGSPTCVPGVDEARQALSRNVYDFIIIDMDTEHDVPGFERISRIRSMLSGMKGRPKASIVAASRHRGTAERFLQMGADDFMLLGDSPSKLFGDSSSGRPC